MDGNLEFRVLVVYLGAMYLFPVIRWRKTRRLPRVVGVRGERQDRARWVATGFFVLPVANYIIDGVWPWWPFLGLPNALRWFAAMPATLAILLLIWACRATEDVQVPGTSPFVDEGPYRRLRHPQLLASSIFFLSLAVLSSNGVVLISTILGVLLLRLVVAPAVEEDLQEAFGKEYLNYRQRTGSFFFQLARIPQATYTVPRKFTMTAVLALTTIFAILFGAMNFMRAEPIIYFFVATEILAICLVQFAFGTYARTGSAVTGAVLLPIWTAVYLGSQTNQLPLVVVGLAYALIALFGAFVGYCIGGLAAGFFLVLDMLDPYLPGAKPGSAAPLSGPEKETPSSSV